MTPCLTSGRHGHVTGLIVAVVIIIAVAMRAYGLDGRFDYDSYDEGVYWQTLRSMSNGYSLYREIFCSQPPVFPLSIYPFYVLFGSTILAARIGVVMLSLLGLAGAYLLGKALAGRAGGIAALVMVVAAPSYLEASQRLQAEGPATAFLFLAAAAAFIWWDHPTGRRGLALAASCGIALLLGTLTKLLDVTAIVPVLMLALARVWQIRREAGSSIGTILRPIAGAIVAILVMSLIVLTPFLSSLPAVVQQTLMFHIAARNALAVWEPRHTLLLYHFLVANAVISAGAAIGIVIATLRRDWRIIPLIAWFLATVLVLLIQLPLFSRHAIVLMPPLVAMSALAWNDPSAVYRVRQVVSSPSRTGVLVIGLFVLAAVLAGALSDYEYYHAFSVQAGSSETQRAAQVAADLQRTTTPDQWVITDAQFIAGLANRDTPPWLVDTSSVRIITGYLTVAELIQAASDAQVHTVLFATDRLSSASLVGFHSWVAQHYHLLRTYGTEIELWTR